MYSISFPNMFNTSRTYLYSDHEATASNLKLLLGSQRYSLLGDPTFGTSLYKVIYAQNSSVLVDLIVEDIYNTIRVFMPQLTVKRSDIKVYQDKEDIYATISATNKLDYTTDLYTVQLLRMDYGIRG